MPENHVVDCDANPETEWKIREHRKLGQLTLNNRDGKLYANGVEVVLYLSTRQEKGESVLWSELSKELKGKPVLNACVSDYLLKHQELIPESWNGRMYFWGSIFRTAPELKNLFGVKYVAGLARTGVGDGRVIVKEGEIASAMVLAQLSLLQLERETGRRSPDHEKFYLDRVPKWIAFSHPLDMPVDHDEDAVVLSS
jgi:hypothetical protein